MARESFDVFCPKCNIEVDARVVAHGHGGFSSDALNPLDEIDTEYHGDTYSVALCRRCNGPFLIKESLHGVPGEFETVTSEFVLYPITARLPLDNVPEPVKRAYDQALRCFTSASHEASALMCRRCLEALSKSLGATGRTLEAKLDSLAQKGLIDKRLSEWAHGVRAIGNEAAHDTDTVISIEDARDSLDFTEALLMYVFVLNVRFAAFCERRKQID